MLCHGNTGKILSNRMSSMRLEYKDDPNGFSDNEKTFLDSSTVQHAGVAHNENWLIDTETVEWLESSGPVLVDVRKEDVLKDSMRD